MDGKAAAAALSRVEAAVAKELEAKWDESKDAQVRSVGGALRAIHGMVEAAKASVKEG